MTNRLFLVATMFNCLLWIQSFAESSDSFIMIVVGHSATYSGARSASGRKEYDFNRKMAYKIMTCLKKKGFSRLEVMDANQENVGNSERAARANHSKPQLLLSIHHDSVQPHYLKRSCSGEDGKRYCDLFRGYSIFYSEKNKGWKNSVKVASSIGESLRKFSFKPTYHHAEKIPGENRALIDSLNGIYRFNELTILSKTHVPSLLIECGVIVNRQEEEQLVNDEYVSKFAAAVADGIVQSDKLGYFNLITE